MKPVDQPQSRPLLTFGQVATQLAISVRSVRRLAGKGDLHVIRIGRQLRVDPADLGQFLKAQRR